MSASNIARQLASSVLIAGGWTLRVVLTNGVESRVALAMFTSRTGFHAHGPGVDKLHSSYHLDGRRHVTGHPGQDKYKRRFHPPTLIRQLEPMADLVGTVELHTLALRNEPHYFTEKGPFPHLHKQPSLLWKIDSRQLVAGARHQLTVGVVGKGGRAALAECINDSTKNGKWTEVQSELDLTQCPSPYLIVLRAESEDAPGVNVAPGIASSSDSATLVDGQLVSLFFPAGMLGKITPAQREDAVWPPAPCEHRETFEILVSPFAPLLTHVGDFVFAVQCPDPKDDGLFELIINPRFAFLRAGNQIIHRLDGHPTAETKVVRLRYGSPDQNTAQFTYMLGGAEYHIRCTGISIMGKGKYTNANYHFEMQW